ncbi:hypothetical protein Ddc_08409 [Ditylenchus destructor]|nr:hypothetical protein Ddc_08409 [Ditylenchus destructor]
MSTTSATERLSMEIESSALTFLSRSQLLRLSTVSYRMRCILGEDFTSKPYLVLDTLENDPYWEINFKYSKIERFIELLAESKFVRFNTVALSWAYLKNDNEKRLLREISYVCQNAELRIKSFGGKMEQQAFMPLITNCRSLYLSKLETIQWLPHIPPSDNLQSVCISENWYNDVFDIPETCLEAIVEFLFKPMNNHKSRKLRLRFTISDQSTQAIADAIKKKFDEATVPVVFTLEWDPHYSRIPNISDDTNHRTSQQLRFDIDCRYHHISSRVIYVLDVCDLEK